MLTSEGFIVCSSLVHIICFPDIASHQVQQQTLGWLKGKLAVCMPLLVNLKGFPLGLQNQLKLID